MTRYAETVTESRGESGREAQAARSSSSSFVQKEQSAALSQPDPGPRQGTRQPPPVASQTNAAPAAFSESDPQSAAPASPAARALHSPPANPNRTALALHSNRTRTAILAVGNTPPFLLLSFSATLKRWSPTALLSNHPPSFQFLSPFLSVLFSFILSFITVFFCAPFPSHPESQKRVQQWQQPAASRQLAPSQGCRNRFFFLLLTNQQRGWAPHISRPARDKSPPSDRHLRLPSNSQFAYSLLISSLSVILIRFIPLRVKNGLQSRYAGATSDGINIKTINEEKKKERKSWL